jgi:hypothetical protein
VRHARPEQFLYFLPLHGHGFPRAALSIGYGTLAPCAFSGGLISAIWELKPICSAVALFSLVVITCPRRR